MALSTIEKGAETKQQLFIESIVNKRNVYCCVIFFVFIYFATQLFGTLSLLRLNAHMMCMCYVIMTMYNLNAYLSITV